MKVIETERLLIRNFKPEDWRDLQEYISQENVMKFESEWDSSDEGCKDDANYFSQVDTFFAVELKKTKKMIGHVFYAQDEPVHFMNWKLGYIFNPSFYGNGYATEACKGVIQYGFDKLGVHRVSAFCNPDNISSWRLLERLSMRREGHCIKKVTFKKTIEGDPIWWDEYQYAILSQEWNKYEIKYTESK